MRHSRPALVRLADRIREQLAAHRLPRDRPDKIHQAHGKGHPCHGCGYPIQRAQVEYRLAIDEEHTYRLHQGCYGLWLAELYRSRLIPPVAEPPVRPAPTHLASSAVHRLLRAKISSGELPVSLPRHASVTKGDGDPCSGCNVRIRAYQMQYRLDFGDGHAIRLHAECERLWRLETGN